MKNKTLRERFEKEFGFISNKGIQCDEITKNKILTFIEKEQARVLEEEIIRLEEELPELLRLEKNGVDTLSQCPHCISMTKTTINGICGKCGGHKAKIGSGIPLNNSTLREILKTSYSYYLGNRKTIMDGETLINFLLPQILTFIEKEQARVLEEEIIRLEGEKKDMKDCVRKGEYKQYTTIGYNQAIQAQIDHHRKTLSNIKLK